MYPTNIKEIWFETDKNEENNITQTGNGILTALLPLALKEGYNIESRIPIDEKLYHNVTTTVIPALCANDSRFFPIKIKSTLTNKLEFNGKDVGTGLSLGLDSFYTIN